MFIAISRMTSLPRHLACAVSVCHIGAVAVFIPFPILYPVSPCYAQVEGHSPKNYPPDDHLRKTIRCNLYNGANRHDHCTNDNGLLPSEPFANSESNDSANKATDAIDCSYSSKDVRLCWTDEVVKFEKVLSYDNTT